MGFTYNTVSNEALRLTFTIAFQLIRPVAKVSV